MPWDNELRFISKGQSRIFVEKKKDIQIVKDVISDLDHFEFGYLPSDLITVWNNDIDDLVYNGKFDIHIPNLIQRCGHRGIGIICRTEAPKKWIEV